MRVLLDKQDGSEEYAAKGVEYISATDDKEEKEKFVAKAKKEVILSTGAFMTPQLLELSGVYTFQPCGYIPSR